MKTGDRAGIIAVIGEERYNKAAALVDTLEPDYEPYQDYTTKPLEEQDADKYMAWILKYARYMNSIPATIFYCEDISDIASQPNASGGCQLSRLYRYDFCSCSFCD